MVEPDFSERRKHKRIPFVSEVKVHAVGSLRCSDLSIGGMFLETVHTYEVGTIIELRFKLSETDEYPIDVQGRVVYQYTGIGVGLCFLNLRPQDRERIEVFINRA
jgi:hypothetical protein